MAPNQESIEAKLAAYVDGDITPQERQEIEAHLQSNPTHRKLLKELGQTRDLLCALPRMAAPVDVIDGFQSQIERTALLEPETDEDGEVAAPTYRLPRFFAMAAVLLMVVGLVALIMQVLPSSKPNKQMADVREPAAAGSNSPEKPAVAFGGGASGGAGGEIGGGAFASKSGSVAESDPSADKKLQDELAVERSSKPTAGDYAIAKSRSLEPRGKSVEASKMKDALPTAPDGAPGVSPDAAREAGKSADEPPIVLVVDTQNPAMANVEVADYLRRNKIEYETVSDSFAGLNTSTSDVNLNAAVPSQSNPMNWVGNLNGGGLNIANSGTNNFTKDNLNPNAAAGGKLTLNGTMDNATAGAVTSNNTNTINGASNTINLAGNGNPAAGNLTVNNGGMPLTGGNTYNGNTLVNTGANNAITGVATVGNNVTGTGAGTLNLDNNVVQNAQQAPNGNIAVAANGSQAAPGWYQDGEGRLRYGTAPKRMKAAPKAEGGYLNNNNNAPEASAAQSPVSLGVTQLDKALGDLPRKGATTQPTGAQAITLSTALANNLYGTTSNTYRARMNRRQVADLNERLARRDGQHSEIRNDSQLGRQEVASAKTDESGFAGELRGAVSKASPRPMAEPVDRAKQEQPAQDYQAGTKAGNDTESIARVNVDASAAVDRGSKIAGRDAVAALPGAAPMAQQAPVKSSPAPTAPQVTGRVAPQLEESEKPLERQSTVQQPQPTIAMRKAAPAEEKRSQQYFQEKTQQVDVLRADEELRPVLIVVNATVARPDTAQPATPIAAPSTTAPATRPVDSGK